MHDRDRTEDIMTWSIWLFVLGAIFLAATRIYSHKPG